MLNTCHTGSVGCVKTFPSLMKIWHHRNCPTMSQMLMEILAVPLINLCQTFWYNLLIHIENVDINEIISLWQFPFLPLSLLLLQLSMKAAMSLIRNVKMHYCSLGPIHLAFTSLQCISKIVLITLKCSSIWIRRWYKVKFAKTPLRGAVLHSSNVLLWLPRQTCLG